jgi:hypothetical protein
MSPGFKPHTPRKKKTPARLMAAGALLHMLADPLLHPDHQGCMLRLTQAIH